MGAYDLLTRHIAKAVETTPATPSLFAEFFPNVDVHNENIVEFDKRAYKNGIAPFVAPTVAGKAIQMDGYNNYIFKLPTMKPNRPITSKDLDKKPFGQTVDSEVSKNARAREAVNKAVSDNENRIDVRLEKMRAEALFDGKLTIVGDGYDDTVTFPRSAANTVDVGAGAALYWDEVGAIIDVDFTFFVQTLANAGKTATHIIGRPATIAYLVDFVKDETDFRRVENGSLRFQSFLNVNGAIYEGTYKNVEIWSYNGVYTDATGATAYMVPEKKVVVLAAQNENEMSYGYATDVILELGLADSYTVSPRNVVTKLLTKDGTTVEIESILTAAPLLKDGDATLVATVLS